MLRPLAALLVLALPAVASAGDVRDLHGRVVPLDRPQVFVTWSLASGDVELLARLAALGPVVAVNTDPVGAKSLLAPYVRSHRLDVTVVADPGGELRARLGLVGPVVAAVVADGEVAAAFTDPADIQPAVVAAR